MKTALLIFAASLLVGVLCVSARPSHYKAEAQLVNRLLKQLARAKVDKTALAQLDGDEETDMMLNLLSKAKAQSEQKDKTASALNYVHKLEREVQMQDFDDEERAEVESLLSTLKDKFLNIGSKVKSGFKKFGSKVRNFFHKYIG